MGFKKARPEYYQGLKVFQENTNQQSQLQTMMASFLSNFKKELNTALSSESITLELKEEMAAVLTQPMNWLDLGSGDGTMTKKILGALETNDFPSPNYEAIDPDPHFREVSQKELFDYTNIDIRDGVAFDGSLNSGEKRDLITGINSLYFANELDVFKEDIDKTLKPTGLGIFIQNKSFTDKAVEALKRNGGTTVVVSVPTEVYFPELSDMSWDLITSRKSEGDIQNSQLSSEDKANTILTKQIIDAMGGISTETEEGQKTAQKYRDRILGDDYGGAGKYVSDNYMIVYAQPNAPSVLKEVLSKASKATKREVSVQQNTI